MGGELVGVSAALTKANGLLRDILASPLFIQTILPFLLVFAVVWSILSMYGPFADNGGERKTVEITEKK